MYVGHFAIGMAIKARWPQLPSLPIFIGIGFLDLLDGLFIMAGWDRVKPDLAAGPYLYFDLNFIDWDHSLLMAVLWSLIWGTVFLKDRQTAVVASLAAFSHFVADWPLHNADLALYPHSTAHFGYGLAHRLGTAAWALEGLFALALCTYTWMIQARHRIRMLWPTVLLAILFVNLSPWLSPMRLAATLPEPATHLAAGALITIGFLIPGVLLTWMVDKNRRTLPLDC